MDANNDNTPAQLALLIQEFFERSQEKNNTTIVPQPLICLIWHLRTSVSKDESHSERMLFPDFQTIKKRKLTMVPEGKPRKHIPECIATVEETLYQCINCRRNYFEWDTPD